MATLTITQPLTVELPPMSEAEFYEFCRRNEDLRIERTAEGKIIVMAPAYTETGGWNRRITTQLANWADEDGRGEAFDSSAGFTLPNGAMRSPDSAWVSYARIDSLPEGGMHAFARLCPEFVIELFSSSDSLREVQAKMREWIENGTELGWLIDPYQRVVYEYTRDGMRRLDDLSEIPGHGPVEGFTLDLRRIWKRLK